MASGATAGAAITGCDWPPGVPAGEEALAGAANILLLPPTKARTASQGMCLRSLSVAASSTLPSKSPANATLRVVGLTPCIKTGCHSTNKTAVGPIRRAKQTGF
eukprot:gnl/MRDRNA2_/MRDRNA2_120399_c0_seq1.p1 gnl/MRDRNA2_/MRDRNA2_120399_c0~~gnl/MRDRNA2_/MRDRNA2_120399_c0_seq1.p1  ORF type:complete len:117 (-),score=16.23 gnl/MRDRNA2_/MRDRNA2_120399_c0_seq1:23-334(-)